MTASDDSLARSVDFTKFELEPHVERALSAAWALAGRRAVTAYHALATVVALSDTVSSPAFSRLAELLPLGARGELQESVVDTPLWAFRVSPGLDEAFRAAEPFFREENRVWGRDFVTFVLLSPDPTVGETAQRAGVDLRTVRDEWFRFVVSDGSHRSPEAWAHWWQSAGVPVPADQTPVPTDAAASPPTFEAGLVSDRVKLLLRGTHNLRRGALTSRGLVLGMVELRQSLGLPNAAAFLVPYLTRGDEGVAVSEKLRQYRDEGESSLTDPDSLKDLLGFWADAQQIARETTPDGEVCLRHVVAAILTQSPTSPCEARKLLDELGLDRTAVLYDFARLMERSRPPRDARAWQEALVRRSPAASLVSLANADTCTGEDCLGVMQDVQAMAALVASRALKPPLSIGLFGNWGAGKTFFMDKLEVAVRRLSEKAKEPGPHREHYWSRIVQVRFNAWHYIDSNLWASLISHLFEQLNAYWSGPGNAYQEAWQKASIQLKLSREAAGEAGKAVSEAEAVYTETERKLAHVRENYALSEAELQAHLKTTIGQAIRDVRQHKGSQVLDEQLTRAEETLKEIPETAAVVREDAVDIYQQARRTCETLGSLRTLLLEKRRTPTARVLMFLILLFALLPVAVAVWPGLLRHAVSAVESLVPLLATVAAVVARFAVAWRRISARLQPLRQLCRTLDATVTELQQAEEQKTATLEACLERARTEREAAQKAYDESEQAVKKAEQELAGVASGEFIAQFVKQRALSDQYRRHLSLISIVHDDLRHLSEVVAGHNERNEDRGGATARDAAPLDLGISRIVLYIDDLDRCPSERVIEVLQAIHLLLAFELFVVVVGVDARWVTTSLRAQYPNMLSARVGPAATEQHQEAERNSGASSEDYLEKIFQIPYWLRPLDAAGAQNILLDLVSADTKGAGAAAAAGSETRTPTALGGAAVTTSAAESPATSDVAPAEPTEAPPVQTEAGVRTVLLQPEVAPEQVMLSDVEIGAMQELAAIIGRSPRETKRFVNIYRLLRAALLPYETAAFAGTIDRPGPFCAPMLLLALSAGAPVTAAALLRRLRTETDSSLQLSRLLPDAMKKGSDEERVRLEWFLQQGEAEFWLGSLAVSNLRPWATRIGQFSFEPLAIQHAGAGQERASEAEGP